MIYITGDTHGGFTHIVRFAAKMQTTIDDVMIILGDTGLNYFIHNGLNDKRTKKLKQEVAAIPLTFFCIHGNHEERPYNVKGYITEEHFGASCYVDPTYPNQIFAKDGEVYDFNGRKTIVIGGAYSVDKFYRLSRGSAWFESEQPNDEIKTYVETQLDNVGWKVDTVLSHTCPISTEPRHLFLPFIDQSTVDTSTEEWLQTIADKLDFDKWYFGHFHDDWINDKYEMLFNSIKEF